MPDLYRLILADPLISYAEPGTDPLHHYIMASRHKDRFEEIFPIRSDNNNILFSRNKDELKKWPELIEGTDIYVETGFGKEKLFKIAAKVVALFDYPEDSISYE